MQQSERAERQAAPEALGARLGPLRLTDPAALAEMRSSLERHGQLTPLVVFEEQGRLEIVDGFKRLRAAQALGWITLRVAPLAAATSAADAKLAIETLHTSRPLSELEQAWLVRSLYRDDGLGQGEIARRMGRHKSWVCRRLMLAESLDPAVQAHVRLGLLRARTAVTVAQLPRGNQLAGAEVVMRAGLTLRQAELFVADVLACSDDAARAALIERRRGQPALSGAVPGPKPSRAIRTEADWLIGDAMLLRRVGARLEGRLLGRPLSALGPDAAEIVVDALAGLVPVLGALERTITRVLGREAAA